MRIAEFIRPWETLRFRLSGEGTLPGAENSTVGDDINLFPRCRSVSMTVMDASIWIRHRQYREICGAAEWWRSVTYPSRRGLTPSAGRRVLPRGL